jgi:DNA-binding transcriptional regulator YiaG
MPNIASALKAEIARVARKQIRAETQFLRKAVTAHRSQIAALKRQLKDLERSLRQARRMPPKSSSATSAAESTRAQRFGAKGFASARRRLGLSAADAGVLFGVSGQTIYHWESGKARPRAKHMAAVAALRTVGKRDITAHLEALKASR